MKDLQPVLNDIKAKNPDAFIALSYPPDTFLITGQSRAIGFNPKVFYAAVGTAFPVYRDKIGKVAEGVMGLGTWNPKTSPDAKAYFDAHVKRCQKEPDRWASAHAWAGLQILQAAVEKVGLDRKALRDYIANNEFDTIIGKIRFKNGENVSTPGRRQPVAGRRVRGGVAAGPRHQPGALPEAGLVTGRAPIDGSAGRPRSRFCLRPS